MDQGNQLFTLALGLVPPWMVDEVRFTAEEKRLDLHVNHWDGVLSWFESRDTRGILEGFNSLLQSAKVKARGYRTHKNFINMAYLILGKLDLRLPT